MDFLIGEYLIATLPSDIQEKKNLFMELVSGMDTLKKQQIIQILNDRFDITRDPKEKNKLLQLRAMIGNSANPLSNEVLIQQPMPFRIVGGNDGSYQFQTYRAEPIGPNAWNLEIFFQKKVMGGRMPVGETQTMEVSLDAVMNSIRVISQGREVRIDIPMDSRVQIEQNPHGTAVYRMLQRGKLRLGDMELQIEFMR